MEQENDEEDDEENQEDQEEGGDDDYDADEIEDEEGDGDDEAEEVKAPVDMCITLEQNKFRLTKCSDMACAGHLLAWAPRRTTYCAKHQHRSKKMFRSGSSRFGGFVRQHATMSINTSCWQSIPNLGWSASNTKRFRTKLGSIPPNLPWYRPAGPNLGRRRPTSTKPWSVFDQMRGGFSHYFMRCVRPAWVFSNMGSAFGKVGVGFDLGWDGLSDLRTFLWGGSGRHWGRDRPAARALVRRLDSKVVGTGV